MLEAKRDYYEVLGAARTAELTEIKQAFRKLAHDRHPDVNPETPGAEARFKECTEAWEVLSDPEKRAAYDHHRLAGLRDRSMPDFPSAAFRDLYDPYSGMDEFGMEMRPVFMFQECLREYLKQRDAKNTAGGAETE